MLFSILKRLFQLKNVIPTLEIQTQKRLGTVKTRWGNVLDCFKRLEAATVPAAA